jgi:MYXO-CTERM domain-containing protein
VFPPVLSFLSRSFLSIRRRARHHPFGARPNGEPNAAPAAEKSMSLKLTCMALATALASSASAEIVCGWTITTAFPTGAGNVPTGQNYTVGAGDLGVQTAGSELRSFHTLAAATYTSPSGNGSQYGFSSNNWSIGDYYEAKVSTLGFSDIYLSWDQTRSSTGPASFELVMSIDGGSNWSTVVANYTVLQSGGGGAPGTWSTTTYNALYTTSVSVAAADNQSEVLFRFRSLVTAAAAGSSRIDNVTISSGPVPAPGALALLGLAGIASRRRRR